METQAEFARFMNAYQDMVFSTAARISGNDAQAEDIAQDVFLKAYQNFEQIKDSPTAGGWLKTVTTRMALNHVYRYRRRWSFFSELLKRDADDQEIEFDVPAGELTADSILSEVDSEQRNRMVEATLRTLPDRYRVPLVLYHFEEMPYAAIAEQLGVSLPKLKTDIQRGRAVMMQALVRQGLQAGNRHE